MTSVLPDDSIFPEGWTSAIFKEVMTETQTMISCMSPLFLLSSVLSVRNNLCLSRFPSEPTHWSVLLPCNTVDSVRMNRNSMGWVQMGHQLDWPWQSPPPAPARPPYCLITCTHQPHLSSHWFSCRSTCLPVALSLSNKDFIVCIVVYGCPRESEYYVYLCAIPSCHWCLPFPLHFNILPGHNKANRRPSGGQKPSLLKIFLQISVLQPFFSIPCSCNVTVPFIPCAALSIHLPVTDARL